MPNKVIPKVTILLATYNGEKYLNDQLRSLRSQFGVISEVIVGDDGSKDATKQILLDWKSSGLIKEIYCYPHIGSTKVFMNLIKKCQTTEYVAFCDQDDIWDHKKLQTQISALNVGDFPQLVFSSRRLILNGSVSNKIIPKRQPKDFKFNSIIENLAAGHTQLLNKTAIDLIIRHDYQEGNYDSWTYLVISHLGAIHFIAEPLVFYRIHEGNQIGISSQNKLFHARKSLNNYKIQTSMFLSQLNELDESNVLTIGILQNFVSACSNKYLILRWFFLFKSQARRLKILDQIATYFMLLRKI
jgi:glycosyltransferase involved in cell wall biosynthesis